jgi:phospholipid/cholesterol/gamma-HCH transport system ATP-binding protein
MVGYTLELVGMESARHKMPSDISGGMRKRAALARAIITEPDIILYDEPTSGLDPVMSRKIDHLIQSLKKTLRITSVVVTHDLISAFEIGDRIAMLSNGEIIECGTPGEFRASRNRTVREFISAQIHEV